MAIITIYLFDKEKIFDIIHITDLKDLTPGAFELFCSDLAARANKGGEIV